MGFVSAAMGLVSLFGASKEAKAAKAAGKAQAAQETMATQEKIFQLKKQERTLAGQTRSGAAGSGVKADRGSVVDIIAEQAATFKHEREVTQKMGASRASSAFQRGQNAADAAMFKGVSGMLQGAAGAGKAGAAGNFFKFG